MRQRMFIISGNNSLLLFLMLLRGRGGPRGRRGDKDEEKWVPCTKLGRLVQQVSMSSVIHVFMSSKSGSILIGS